LNDLPLFYVYSISQIQELSIGFLQVFIFRHFDELVHNFGSEVPAFPEAGIVRKMVIAWDFLEISGRGGRSRWLAISGSK